VVTLVRGGDLSHTWQFRVVLGAAALIPPIWHAVMRNHTTVHFWFTYRSFAVAFGIVLMAATARSLRQGSDPDRIDDITGQTPDVIDRPLR
jgi:peptidoglycan/LPS O-acetylase OafA/YrhL